MTRIAIDHRTRYDFSVPQTRLVQALRLKPQDTIDQTVVQWHIGVDCDVRLREHRDGFGNCVTMLYAEGPIDHIALHVQGEVLTAGQSGTVRGAHEPLPPGLFARTTDRTRASAAMRAFAGEAMAGEAMLDRLHALNLAICERFEMVEAARDSGAAAADIFAEATASVRDLAHVFIGCARDAGQPARYVSGYRADGGHHPAPHAWAEAHVDGLGWIAFDPSRGVCADTSYVRVAVALDAFGASPLAGFRIGEGDERLDVDVQAEPLGVEE